MKKFLATVVAATATALLCAPSAQAYTSDEQDFIDHLDAISVMNSSGDAALVRSGWQICTILAEGYSRPWTARQLYLGSQENNGSVAGVDYAHAQAIVYYANADLCPEVG